MTLKLTGTFFDTQMSAKRNLLHGENLMCVLNISTSTVREVFGLSPAFFVDLLVDFAHHEVVL